MTLMSEDDCRVLEALREAVADALERKRRLGEYAVIWHNDGPEFIGPNAPSEAGRHSTSAASTLDGVAESRDDD